VVHYMVLVQKDNVVVKRDTVVPLLNSVQLNKDVKLNTVNVR